MKPSYSIEKPCSEDWEKMTTEQQGRHCQVCCKTVVDFSEKSDNEIVDFLKSNAENKICGRFKTEQLNPRPTSRASRPANRYRVFFAALFLVFGGMLFTSCASHGNHGPEPMGEVAYIPDSTEQHQKIDTIIPVQTDTTKKTGNIQKPKCIKPEVVEHENFLMGDIAYDPNDTLH
ncbi:hypothetical protein BH09BAC5_BH09BAC5_29600 [soil metagenome]